MRNFISLSLLLFVSTGFAADLDRDGIDDAWELIYGLDPSDPTDALIDTDGDGFVAKAEANRSLTDPNKRDTDGDFLWDKAEFITHGTDPNKRDTDGDWLPDGEEIYRYGTSPVKSDTDGDGVSDFLELFNGFNPVDPNDIDGYSDNDRDGLLAWQELAAGTDPENHDTDDDQIPDGWEQDNGLNPRDFNDAFGDLDNDGYTAYQEFRLGSDLNDPISIPPFLSSNFVQSFEDQGLASNWQQLEHVDGAGWARNCESGKAHTGQCVYKDGGGGLSRVRFMANFPAGELSFSWLAFIYQNSFTVTVDGIEAISYTDGLSGWVDYSVHLDQGVHEIVFTAESSGGNWHWVSIDELRFRAGGNWPRPYNDSCFAPPFDDEAGDVALEFPYQDIPYFTKATKLLQAPDDGSRWFVLEQEGLLKVFDAEAVDYAATVRTYLDFTGDIQFIQEGGLIGLAFDPNFPTTPELYVVYTSAANYTTLSRIKLDNTDAPVSPVEEVLLRVKKEKTGHYSGDIAFGNDGMLYMSVGDEGPATAQDTTNLFGSMLRIDVLGVPYPLPGYNIPAGNAFDSSNPKCGPTKINTADCPEIYAWGLRNPWRWNFDRMTGDLWLGDVGNHEREEFDLIVAGGNYGWPCYEGSVLGQGFSECNPDELDEMIPPVADFSHVEGRAAIGGVVYRGTAMPERYGRYIFSDLGQGPIWELLPNGVGGYTKSQIQAVPGIFATSTIGADGEIYFASYYDPAAGTTSPPRIMKLVPGAGDAQSAELVPDNLADTGCVNAVNPRLPAEALIPYDVNSKLWSDGAVKERFMALPDNTTIDIDGNDDWHFPVGSVLVKNFYLNGKIVETRLLMNRLHVSLGVGQWDGVTYEWDEDELSATRVVGGKSTTIDGQPWTFPSEVQCSACHTKAAGDAIGPETAQLNGLYHYPASSGLANQLEELDRIGMFVTPLPDVEVLPRLADPADVSETLEDRARAYLHANCAECHQPGTGVPSTMDLRYSTLLKNTNICDIAPERSDLGLVDPKLIAPGDPDNSIILNRMSRRDVYGMPPIGTHIVDMAGMAVIQAWIEELDSCQ